MSLQQSQSDTTDIPECARNVHDELETVIDYRGRDFEVVGASKAGKRKTLIASYFCSQHRNEGRTRLSIVTVASEARTMSSWSLTLKICDPCY